MCPVRYELNGLSFVEFKLFSNAPGFEKEQTAQLVYENKGLEGLQVIKLAIDFTFMAISFGIYYMLGEQLYRENKLYKKF